MEPKNLCISEGPLSTCSGINAKDRRTCCHFEGGTDCDSYRGETWADHCDCIPAQKNEPPKKEELIELSLDDFLIEERPDPAYTDFDKFARSVTQPLLPGFIRFNYNLKP